MQEKFKDYEAQTKSVHGQDSTSGLTICKLCSRLGAHEDWKHFSFMAVQQ